MNMATKVEGNGPVDTGQQGSVGSIKHYAIHCEAGEDDCQCVGPMWMGKWFGPFTAKEMNGLGDITAYVLKKNGNRYPIRNVQVFELARNVNDNGAKLPVNDFSLKKEGDFWVMEISWKSGHLKLKSDKLGNMVSMINLVSNDGYDIDQVSGI